ncbi:hypothetical protein FISHEDRAFT_57342 [Fistulina hepatica ATCC 64428]|uniref:Uncharacterized protein n=1 Tax=Fistulina hepatica ATCC 64428 TaxID=1128425 RepID=A0A0D7AHA0_9AGAR|nr:hypothetical protein FISHEDRAFT_57342 [Fistulina hepatica ATCC 64428]
MTDSAGHWRYIRPRIYVPRSRYIFYSAAHNDHRHDIFASVFSCILIFACIPYSGSIIIIYLSRTDRWSNCSLCRRCAGSSGRISAMVRRRNRESHVIDLTQNSPKDERTAILRRSSSQITYSLRFRFANRLLASCRNDAFTVFICLAHPSWTSSHRRWRIICRPGLRAAGSSYIRASKTRQEIFGLPTFRLADSVVVGMSASAGVAQALSSTSNSETREPDKGRAPTSV